jgi:hypothetical protein
VDSSSLLERRIRYVLILFAAFGFLLQSNPVEARDERIANLTVRFEDGFVVVSADLILGFTPEAEDDIRSGVPKDLYYTVLLKQRKLVWFDEEVSSKTILYRVKYDTLKKQYIVLRISGRESQETILEDYASMKRLISRIEDAKIAPVKVLQKKGTYYVSIKTEMKASKIPLYLDYVFFFVPFLEIDTPWADSAPFYRPEESRY